MGPEDQHPWDREDEEIRQAFAKKDAEIERLKEDHQIVRNSLDAADAKLMRYETLITELREALDITTQLLLVSELPVGVVENKISENMLLQQRAREATR